jgi:hypothetical protein
MGLDAHVRCNCAREGKTKPFPFPGRLAFEDSGEPYLLSANIGTNDMSASKDMDELGRFDEWESAQGCEHGRFLVDVHIGNVAYVGYIREWIKTEAENTKRQFPVLSEKVVYSGSHGGDWISSPDAQRLLEELEVLSSRAQDDYHRAFIKTMKLLGEASLASDNPIVF